MIDYDPQHFCALDKVPKDFSGIVVFIDNDERIRKRMTKLGLDIGSRIVIKHSGIDGGKIKIATNNTMITLSRAVARKIKIKTEHRCENITLDEIGADRYVKISAIYKGWGITQQLEQAGFTVGDTVYVIKNNISGGPLMIRNEKSSLTISRGAARKVTVIPLKSSAVRP